MRSLVIALSLTSAFGVIAAEQVPGRPERVFEAVSIRPRDPNAERVFPPPPSPNRFVRTNTTVRSLMTFAFDLLPVQIIDGPAWIDADRYEVTAVASAVVAPRQMRVLVQGMLEDRFSLRTHRGTRELPVFTLTVARRDGGLGPAVRTSNVDCPAVRSAVAAGNPSPASADVTLRCTGARFGITRGVFRREYRGESMAQFAQTLAADAGRVVIDRTGLSGTFDFEFAVGAEHLPGLPSPPPEFLAPPGQDTGPGLDTALREQLGLKLESGRAPIEVLVIDSVERPTPN